jgi:large subunit ribosomal protein L6
MSRVGLKPIEIPNGTTVEIVAGGDLGGQKVIAKGPKGELSRSISKRVQVELKDNTLVLSRSNEEKQSKADHGLYRALINNIVKGVSEGYVKELHIEGIGYRAQMTGDVLELALGYSHKIKLNAPAGILIEVADQTEIKISGTDKQMVGEIAAKIRSFRKPEPYKGKGVRYKDEQVRRKDVKSTK